MRAAVMEGIRQPLVVRDVPDPTPPEKGVVVRVEANGICRSDWHLWMGDWSWIGLQLPLPHVLGHEFCGVIDEVGPGVTRWRRGDRVLVPFSVGEGSCEWCRSGHHNICDTMLTPGVVSWGGYGRRAGVPFADVNLVPLPESIGFVEAASMGCRYMTSFHGLVDQAKVGAGEWVAVHGCGGVGLSAVQIATALGANVIAVDVADDERLADALHDGGSHRDLPVCDAWHTPDGREPSRTFRRRRPYAGGGGASPPERARRSVRPVSTTTAATSTLQSSTCGIRSPRRSIASRARL